MIKNSIPLALLILILLSCSSKTIDYRSLSAFDEENNLNAVIEIPVGTNDKIEFNYSKNTFEIDSIDGKPRVIKFLPYPINYGFIPSTENHADKETKEDPLDILVFGKALKTAQILKVRPIGILKMIDDGEADDKILSIPLDPNYQILDIKDFKDLSENYPKLRDMIADWFLNYDKNAKIQILGWFDEAKALKEIKAKQSINIQTDAQ